MIRRYIIWRNNHAYDERLRRIVAREVPRLDVASRSSGGSRRGHRGYPVRMRKSPASPRVTGAAAAAYAELGLGYIDTVVASFHRVSR
jgi:hypothetical protein